MLLDRLLWPESARLSRSQSPLALVPQPFSQFWTTKYTQVFGW
jgi:hypothetical protein